MKVEYLVVQLDGDETWNELSNLLGGDAIPVVRSLIRHLRTIDIACYVLESRYIDRDYSADYLSF